MSGSTTTVTRQPQAVRRVRHDVRDAVLTMAFSVSASATVAGVVVVLSILARTAN